LNLDFFCLNYGFHLQEDILIHYENNTPFLTISPLVRHIEVSHWGNIAVEETLDIHHTGAKLKGSFSRFEYQREQSGLSSVKAFKVIFPFNIGFENIAVYANDFVFCFF